MSQGYTKMISYVSTVVSTAQTRCPSDGEGEAGRCWNSSGTFFCTLFSQPSVVLEKERGVGVSLQVFILALAYRCIRQYFFFSEGDRLTDNERDGKDDDCINWRGHENLTSMRL